MNDLIIDPNIKVWVFVPIILISFLMGVFRHYTATIFPSEKSVDVQTAQCNHVIFRSKLLRQNGGHLPRAAFLARREAFNNQYSGYLRVARDQTNQPNIVTDPNVMLDIIKSNVTNVIPMVVIGGWINWMFTGFITTRVPFPLTLRFKAMLQRGIGLLDLDASWVSSASWYFLNVFGLRSIYALVLCNEGLCGESEYFGRHTHDVQMVAIANTSSAADAKVICKDEWEALEIMDYDWLLADVELDVLSMN